MSSRKITIEMKMKAIIEVDDKADLEEIFSAMELHIEHDDAFVIDAESSNIEVVDSK